MDRSFEAPDLFDVIDHAERYNRHCSSRCSPSPGLRARARLRRRHGPARGGARRARARRDRRRARSSAPRAAGRQRRLQSVPAFEELGARRFDYAVSVNVLEHCDDDAAIARALMRRLAPGGRCLIYVPRSRCSGRRTTRASDTAALSARPLRAGSSARRASPSPTALRRLAGFPRCARVPLRRARRRRAQRALGAPLRPAGLPAEPAPRPARSTAWVGKNLLLRAVRPASLRARARAAGSRRARCRARSRREDRGRSGRDRAAPVHPRSARADRTTLADRAGPPCRRAREARG